MGINSANLCGADMDELLYRELGGRNMLPVLVSFLLTGSPFCNFMAFFTTKKPLQF